MRRAIREHLRDFVAIIVLAALALLALFVILYNQKAALPAWVPGLGQDFYELNAELTSAQAVTPGQGQAIDIAGIQVGKVGAVNLEGNHAVVRMDIEKKYADLIHRDATLLLRPKTGLNDMVIQVDPGSQGKTPPEGASIPLAQTQPNVTPDQILATLDGDTQDYLRLLLNGGGGGLGGRSKELSAGLRRLEPFTRDLARIGRALAVRRNNIRHDIHNFRLIVEELGRHDTELARFVDSSNAVLGTFADQQASIQQALRELPPTLRAAQAGLGVSDRLSVVMRPALLRSIPGAVALKPALESSQRLFRATTPTLRNQIRPFTRTVRPVLRHTVQLAAPLAKSSAGLRGAFTELNKLFNLLAFNPPGSKHEGYLFYLSWFNHELASIYLTQDAEGPLQRGLIMVTCSTAKLAELTAANNELLQTELQTSGLPASTDICPATPTTTP